jgi:hypothetical protein
MGSIDNERQHSRAGYREAIVKGGSGILLSLQVYALKHSTSLESRRIRALYRHLLVSLEERRILLLMEVIVPRVALGLRNGLLEKLYTLEYVRSLKLIDI